MVQTGVAPAPPFLEAWGRRHPALWRRRLDCGGVANQRNCQAGGTLHAAAALLHACPRGVLPCTTVAAGFLLSGCGRR